jgi:drug/metabolite transporter (DMT)-like permease
LFYPGAVTLLTYESNRVLGPTLTGTASSTTPVFAVACSVLLLGERPPILVVVGGLVIVAGLILLAMRAPLHGAQGWRLLLPLSAAALRGAAQSLIKVGLLLWPSAFAATLMTYTASAAVVGAAAGAPRGSRRFARAALPWFAGVAALNGTAVLLMCYALERGTVGVVSPIVATYPLFTMVFSAVLLKEERLTRLGILGALLTVAGVVLVATA